MQPGVVQRITLAPGTFTVSAGAPTVATVGSNRRPPQPKGRCAQATALDRVAPGCAPDPNLTRRLVSQATRTLIGAARGPSTTENGA